MALAERILEKRFVRSDRIWTRRFIYQSTWLRRIPFFLDTWALDRSQYWTRERMEQYQDVRITQVLRSAALIPLWEAAFTSAGISPEKSLGREALHALPISTKRTFTEQPESAYVDAALRRRSVQDRTSGSTGTPFIFYHNTGYVLRSFAIAERQVRIAGRGVRYPLIILRRALRMGYAFVRSDFFYIESYTSLKHRIDDLLALMKRRGRVTLFIWGSVAVEFARLLRERGAHPDIGGMIVTGEAITEQERTDIEAATGAKVTTAYAGSDVGRLATECEARRLHIHDEWAYVEIVDANGSSLPAGSRGRIVVTTFENDVMPFIRFETGDQGVISDDACPCGRTLRTLRLEGRQIHILQFPDGRSASVLDIKAIFDRLPGIIREYQIVRTAPISFSIRVVAGERFDEQRSALTDKLVRLIHPEARVEWETVSHIEPLSSGKAAYFVDATTRHA